MLNAAQHDRLLRFGGVIKAAFEASGAPLVLISRSGLDLARFGVRYSHAGLSLKAGPDTAWSVRQLYFACDEQGPRIFDQGMAAFLLGSHEPSIGFVSAVLLPPHEAARLERAAQDNRQALQLLGARYSANAYPFSVQYQNCNQWLAELFAAAFGSLDDSASPRAAAQRWLSRTGYAPGVFDVKHRWLMWAGAFVPWVHNDDHPPEDIADKRYRVSMPTSLEALARALAPQARRIEFCHNETHIVVREGWEPIADGCVPGPNDTVIPFD